VHARVAWLVVGLSAVCAVLDTAITAASLGLTSEEAWAVHGWPLATAATVGCALMGALIISRYPRHPIGWLLCVASLSSISMATEAFSVWVLDHAGPGPDVAGHVAAWVAVLFGAPLALTALTLIYLVAPDGRLASRRWRWVARMSVAGLALYTLGALTVSPTDFSINDYEPNVVSGAATAIGVVLVAVALVSAAVGVVRRLRRAEGSARQQLRWVGLSAVLLAFGLVFLLSVQAGQGGGREQTLLSATPLFAAYLAFPICIAVAVLRHRLFDLDLVVNRALVIAIATAVVAAGYVVAVTLLGTALRKGAGGFWPSLLATALVALAFQPVRRWVVRLADRVAYGDSAVPYESLADFSRRLGDSPDPTTLLPAVAEVSARAVGARRATARLLVAGAPDRTATWPVDPRDPIGSTAGIPAGEVPVVDRGEELGSISVEMPPGRTLRAADERLLADLADQAGIAFRNVQVAAELAGQVEELSRRTGELAESRRRLITAADGERARLERSIAREVVPHLEPLPRRLAALAGAPEPLTAEDFRPLLASATAALEALREITRGVFPAQLTRSGLEPALTSLLGRTGTGRLVVEPTAAGRRHDPRAEAAAYFCVVEAARDLDPPLEVRLSAPDSRLLLMIVGGLGGEVAVDAMRDRVETAGGTVTDRHADRGTTVEVSLPSEPAGVRT
jgi:hypothetical protein